MPQQLEEGGAIMLKKVWLMVNGLPTESDRSKLSQEGTETINWIGQKITENGLKPQIVFFNNNRLCRDSARILAESIGLGGHTVSLGSIFLRQFRNALRIEESARAYFGKVSPISDSVEEVVVVSPVLGEIFPKQDEKVWSSYTSWPCSAVWILDIQTQILFPPPFDITRRIGSI